MVADHDGVHSEAQALERRLLLLVIACAATAACRARERGVPLTLVHVVAPPRPPVAPGGAAPPPRLLYATAERVDGPIGAQLDRLAAGADATLPALGPRSHGPLAGALPGSPSVHPLRRATRPVMVCPSPDAVLA
jgi:hypothetical protein